MLESTAASSSARHHPTSNVPAQIFQSRLHILYSVAVHMVSDYVALALSENLAMSSHVNAYQIDTYQMLLAFALFCTY